MSKLILIFVLLFFSSCMQFRTNDKQTHKFFKKKNQRVFINRRDKLRVIQTDTVNFETAILFVHGTPGSADVYYDYLADSSLLSKATLITYDRPGYGFSDYGCAMTSIKDQVNVILPTIKNYKKVYVVGHSYGGPIAAYLGLKSKNVVGVVLVAPTMYPHREKFYQMAKIGKSRFGRIFSSKAMYVASLEKLGHEETLKQIEIEWSNFKCQLTHIHSSDDKIVPFDNVNYTKKMFTSAKLKIVELNEGNHFLPWNHFDLVKRSIMDMIE